MKEYIPENKSPANQAAKQWLLKRGLSPNPMGLYLTQWLEKIVEEESDLPWEQQHRQIYSRVPDDVFLGSPPVVQMARLLDDPEPRAPQIDEETEKEISVNEETMLAHIEWNLGQLPRDTYDPQQA